MTMIDAIGGVACLLVLFTFMTDCMQKLRLLGIASNVAFILYAGLAELTPILILHSALLVTNLARLLRMYAREHSCSARR